MIEVVPWCGPSSVSFAATFSHGEKEKGWCSGVGTGSQVLFDLLENGLRVSQHFVVLKSQDTNALRFEPLGTLKVVGLGFRAVVGRAVQFNHQQFFVAVKVSPISPQHFLANKFTKLKFAIPQIKPQPCLRRRQILTTRSSQRSAIRRHIALYLSNPFSRREKVAAKLTDEGASESNPVAISIHQTRACPRASKAGTSWLI